MIDNARDIKTLIQQMETNDLDEWGQTSMKLADFGSPACEVLCEELRHSVKSISGPSIVIQRDSTISTEAFVDLENVMSKREHGDFRIGKRSMVMEVTADKIEVKDDSFVQGVTASVMYVADHSNVTNVIARELWVAPRRKVNNVFA